ncbi:uncharacterized protein PG998_004546 [Apiospora kogelbergensis]|uniref:uncharacterized protein n=1 Tax=Apiospora kogelbergensis TaxID=1337665 RepID=UPI00312FC44E
MADQGAWDTNLSNTVLSETGPKFWHLLELTYASSFQRRAAPRATAGPLVLLIYKIVLDSVKPRLEPKPKVQNNSDNARRNSQKPDRGYIE